MNQQLPEKEIEDKSEEFSIKETQRANQVLTDYYSNLIKVMEDMNKANAQSSNKIQKEVDFKISDDILIDKSYLITNHEDLNADDNILGAGAIGRVFSGTFKNKKVAIKDIYMKSDKSPPEQKVFSEIAMMCHLKHDNLVKLEGYCMTSERYKIVMELMEGGSAHDWKKKDLTPKQKLKIVLDAAKGMDYLHNYKNPVIHRDLKTMNLMIDKPIKNREDLEFTCKIADYGVARFIIGNKNQLKTLTNTGTPIWMAPELLSKGKSGVKIDIYSFGMVLFEVFSENVPFHDYGRNGNSLTVEIVNTDLRPNTQYLQPDTPDKIKDLIDQCWDSDPSNRPDFKKIVGDLQKEYDRIK